MRPPLAPVAFFARPSDLPSAPNRGQTWTTRHAQAPTNAVDQWPCQAVPASRLGQSVVKHVETCGDLKLGVAS